jgi:hypothetical protein
VAVGFNVTLKLQLAPAARLLPQVFVLENGALALTDEMERAAVPVLVRVTICGALVVLSNCAANLIGVVGEKLATPVLSRVMTSPYLFSETTRSGK